MNLMQGIFSIHKLFIEIQDSSIKYQTKQLRNILSTFIILFVAMRSRFRVCLIDKLNEWLYVHFVSVIHHSANIFCLCFIFLSAQN